MYTFLSPAAAFACAIALSTSVTNVKVVAPATRTSRGRCVGTKTGILNGGSSPQPCTWSYTPRQATTAPAAANNSSIIQRSPPGRSTSPPVPSGCSSPASGPVMNPSSDIDRLISTTPIWASCNHGLGHQHTLGPPPCPASPARGVARSHRVSRAIGLVGEATSDALVPGSLRAREDDHGPQTIRQPELHYLVGEAPRRCRDQLEGDCDTATIRPVLGRHPRPRPDAAGSIDARVPPHLGRARPRTDHRRFRRHQIVHEPVRRGPRRLPRRDAGNRHN